MLQHILAVELPLPQVVRQHDHARPAGFSLVRDEPAPHGGRNPERVEKVDGDYTGDQPTRMLRIRQRESARCPRRHMRELSSHRDDVVDIEQVIGWFRELLTWPGIKWHVELWERHQVLRPRKWQGSQHRRIDSAEHGSRSADAECQHTNDRNGEPWPLPQPSQRIADVLGDVIKRSQSPHVATRFLLNHRIPEMQPRGNRRFRSRCARPSDRIGAELAMQPHLFTQLVCGAISLEEQEQAAPPLSEVHCSGGPEHGGDGV